MIIEPNNCYNIDCEIGMKLMQTQGLKADWCITDPPYGINFDNIYESRGGTQAKTEATAKRFYKAKNCNEDSIGIGLSLAKTIIEQNNGYIKATSEVGKGTLFEIKYIK